MGHGKATEKAEEKESLGKQLHDLRPKLYDAYEAEVGNLEDDVLCGLETPSFGYTAEVRSLVAQRNSLFRSIM